jgi:hypothetical protein
MHGADGGNGAEPTESEKLASTVFDIFREAEWADSRY